MVDEVYNKNTKKKIMRHYSGLSSDRIQKLDFILRTGMFTVRNKNGEFIWAEWVRVKHTDLYYNFGEFPE